MGQSHMSLTLSDLISLLEKVLRFNSKLRDTDTLKNQYMLSPDWVSILLMKF